MEFFTGSLLAVIIVVAVFDFTNGFHDAADMVATAIASRAMAPGNQSIAGFFDGHCHLGCIPAPDSRINSLNPTRTR